MRQIRRAGRRCARRSGPTRASRLRHASISSVHTAQRVDLRLVEQFPLHRVGRVHTPNVDREPRIGRLDYRARATGREADDGRSRSGDPGRNRDRRDRRGRAARPTSRSRRRASARRRRRPAPATEEIDGRGLCLAPGFIDPHTHLDANLFWDPDLTPSSGYGVTTVVTGNCGYTLAPVNDATRDYVIDVMSVVEAIPREALVEGVPWDWSTLDEYFARLDRVPRPRRTSRPTPVTSRSAPR